VGVSRGASIKEEEEEEATGDVGEGGVEVRGRADATDAESVLLMTSRPSGGTTTTTTWWRVRRLLHHLCQSRRFKNPQVEMLYQRYFLRMNQSNMTHLLGLLLGLCSVLGLLQLSVALYSSSWEPDSGLIAVGVTLACCVAVYAGESSDCSSGTCGRGGGNSCQV
jgi:hypothetical protein